SASIRAWNEAGRTAARRCRDLRAAGADARAELELVNGLCDRVNGAVRGQVDALLDAGKIVGTVGGDHGAVFGAIAAHAERFPGFGILHFDAHADLRHEYEGFVWSHASIMNNVVRRLPGVARLVQVGIRDYCAAERDLVRDSSGRIRCFYDAD